ncbi:hypothetical protein Q8F55_004130 [Vanrija albida]|uniref:Uncharacterized protein n=1 Tax=Vanrija albida TaxID=181172 RepID=A0ABR3Q697_9TREE
MKSPRPTRHGSEPPYARPVEWGRAATPLRAPPPDVDGDETNDADNPNADIHDDSGRSLSLSSSALDVLSSSPAPTIPDEHAAQGADASHDVDMAAEPAHDVAGEHSAPRSPPHDQIPTAAVDSPQPGPSAPPAQRRSPTPLTPAQKGKGRAEPLFLSRSASPDPSPSASPSPSPEPLAIVPYRRAPPANQASSRAPLHRRFVRPRPPLEATPSPPPRAPVRSPTPIPAPDAPLPFARAPYPPTPGRTSARSFVSVPYRSPTPPRRPSQAPVPASAPSFVTVPYRSPTPPRGSARHTPATPRSAARAPPPPGAVVYSDEDEDEDAPAPAPAPASTERKPQLAPESDDDIVPLPPPPRAATDIVELSDDEVDAQPYMPNHYGKGRDALRMLGPHACLRIIRASVLAASTLTPGMRTKRSLLQMGRGIGASEGRVNSWQDVCKHVGVLDELAEWVKVYDDFVRRHVEKGAALNGLYVDLGGQ